ncbi:hypothetical protein Droror1_Dr00024097 [Drosera rotundifolia]
MQLDIMNSPAKIYSASPRRSGLRRRRSASVNLNRDIGTTSKEDSQLNDNQRMANYSLFSSDLHESPSHVEPKRRKVRTYQPESTVLVQKSIPLQIEPKNTLHDLINP